MLFLLQRVELVRTANAASSNVDVQLVNRVTTSLDTATVLMDTPDEPVRNVRIQLVALALAVTLRCTRHARVNSLFYISLNFSARCVRWNESSRCFHDVCPYVRLSVCPSGTDVHCECANPNLCCCIVLYFIVVCATDSKSNL